MITPEQGLAHLAALPPSNIKMGLSRVQQALAKLGHPETKFPALHVAGTNGKGSTCAIAASCLQQRYLTGLYTSPHLIRVNERIKVDGVDISDELLGQRIAEVLEVLTPQHELTYFEFGTIVAFWHFAKEGVDIAVLETGLGGRLDATTACQPLVTCLTPIDFDHQAYLGTTLPEIAGEKAGIIKEGVPVVSSRQAPEVLEVFTRVASERHAPLIVEGKDFSSHPNWYLGASMQVHGLAVPLLGAHQVQNMSLALACLEQLARRGFPLTVEHLRTGVHDTQWPGRLEEFGSQPLVVLDGAHNPAGVEVLLTALDQVYAGRPVQLVFGVFADKDSEPMMRRLFPRCAALHLTAIDNPRSKPPDSYLTLAKSLNAQVDVHHSAEEALAHARAQCPSDGLVLVAGSLFLVGQLRATLVGEVASLATG